MRDNFKKIISAILIIELIMGTVLLSAAEAQTSSAVQGSFPVLTTVAAATAPTTTTSSSITTPAKVFSDVSTKSYAFSSVQRLRELGITNGLGNNKFGYGKSINRGDFLVWLTHILKYEKYCPAIGSFSDLQDKKSNHFIPVETALKYGIITKSSTAFKPLVAITRQEAVMMIIRCLGLDSTAKKYEKLEKPYSDVTVNNGYILLAKDFGLLSISGTLFKPSSPLTRELAADMLVKLYDKLQKPLKELHAFYAISSNSQRDKINKLTSVGFGWSSLNFDEESNTIVLDTSRKDFGLNDYYLPEGFTKVLDETKNAGASGSLMVYAAQGKLIDPDGDGIKIGLPEYVLTNPTVYKKLIDDIASTLKQASRGTETGSFDGVTIDFEGMKGETLKKAFNTFLTELNIKLDADGKKLFVAVHPTKYYNGYDYKTIGNISDRVILMAHDYNATSLTESYMSMGYDNTPLTPVNEIYYALKTITDSKTGITDRKKLWLQLSFKWISWNKIDGKTINSTPAAFSLSNFISLLDKSPTVTFPAEYRNPKLTFTDPATSITSTVWYEDSRSVVDKIRLAKLFGLQGISIWRLGSIPDENSATGLKYNQNIWQIILKEAGKY